MGAPESLILEYKRDVHAWADVVKELDAFANTFGGHLLLGADADKSGRLTRLPGIDPVPGFEQKIIDFCFTRVVPPLTPFPSPAIALPGTTKVAYVLHVPPSYAGPHFLVNRGGAYVRVAEHSRPYEPRLAEWGELTHLAERRQRAIDQRAWLRDRARRRADWTLPSAPVVVEFFASPSFPTQPRVELVKLHELTGDPEAPALKGRLISGDVVPLSLPETLACVQSPKSSQNLYYELTVYGSLHATVAVGNTQKEIFGGTEFVPLLDVLTDTLLWLEHARFVFRRIGYEGPVSISVTLRRMGGRFFVWSALSATTDARSKPRFNEDAIQEMETTTAAMPSNIRRDAYSLFLPIAYATDMREILHENKDALIQQAVERLAVSGVTLP